MKYRILKNKTSFIIFLLVIFCGLPITQVHASQVGFVDKPIWYSTDKWVEGDTVTISTLVVNSESTALYAKVQFYDGTKVLGEKVVTIASKDAVIISLPWKVTLGEHSISAKIVAPSLVDKAGKKTTITPSLSETSKDTFFVSKKVIANTATTTGDSGAISEIDKAVEYIKDKTPAGVSESASGILATTESVRENWQISLEDKKTTQQQTVDEMNKTEQDRLDAKQSADPERYIKNLTDSSKGESPLKKPISYILIFLYSILLFIIKNSLIFYGVVVILAILIIKRIIGIFKK
jgi:hypothetical protein